MSADLLSRRLGQELRYGATVKEPALDRASLDYGPFLLGEPVDPGRE
jgi:hypothetical protein